MNICKYTGLIGFIILFCGLSFNLIIEIIRNKFSIKKNTISDLGTSSNPYNKIFNISLSTSAIFFLIYCIYLNNKVDGIGLGLIFIDIGLISMFFIGIYTTEKHNKIHHIFTCITFCSIFIGIIIIIFGVPITAIPYVICFTIVGMLFSKKRNPILEWAFFIIIIVACFSFMMWVL